jgi:hypothetical protein
VWQLRLLPLKDFVMLKYTAEVRSDRVAYSKKQHGSLIDPAPHPRHPPPHHTTQPHAFITTDYLKRPPLSVPFKRCMPVYSLQLLQISRTTAPVRSTSPGRSCAWACLICSHLRNTHCLASGSRLSRTCICCHVALNTHCRARSPRSSPSIRTGVI